MTKVFISYRRADSAGIVGRICDRLDSQFGRDNIFVDVDSIPPGVDFREHLGQELDRCDALVAVIGNYWHTDQAGQRRLDDPADFVRIEVETALGRGVPVIPVLVNDARMPGEQELPASLGQLPYRNAIEVGHGRDFNTHITRLVDAIRATRRGPLVAPSETQIQMATRLHNEATQLVMKGRWELAVEKYGEAIRKNPSGAHHYGGRAVAYGFAGEHAKSIADHCEAIRLDPGDFMKYHQRSMAHRDNGDYDLSIDDCNEMIRLKPDNPAGYSERAHTYSKKALFDLAIGDCIEAIRRGGGWAVYLQAKAAFVAAHRPVPDFISEFLEKQEQSAEAIRKPQSGNRS